MVSFIVDSCRDQRFSLETWDGSNNDRLGSMHTSDHRKGVSVSLSRTRSIEDRGVAIESRSRIAVVANNNLRNFVHYGVPYVGRRRASAIYTGSSGGNDISIMLESKS